MRRTLLTGLVVVVMPLSVASCESGPNQPYSPPPPGAGSIWNGSPGTGGLGDGGGYAPDASQAYADAGVGNGPCTASQEAAIWGALFTEPIVPGGLAGGLDLEGGPLANGASGYVNAQTPFTLDPTKETWSGITLQQAENILCQGTPTQTFPGVTNEVGWGENLEVNAIYDPATHRIRQLVLTTGYAGALSLHDRYGNTLTLSLNGQPMTQTSQGGTVTPVMLDWNDPSSLYPIVDDLNQALNGPSPPPVVPGATCVDTGDCQITNLGAGGGEISFPSVGVSIYTATTVGSAVANSTPTIVELSLVKLLPFVGGATLLKLDPEGPTSTTMNVYNTGSTCKYVLGMSFGDFDTQCVQVYPAEGPNSQTLNAVQQTKLFGGMGHTAEAYQFDLTGIVPQFAASSLPPTTVIADGQKPGPTDTAYQLTLDPTMFGNIANDWQDNDTVGGMQDLHGFGLVTLEWANLVQHYMQKAYGVTTELGDPRCLSPNSPGAPAAGAICSGLEGIVTTAPPGLVALPQQQANALGMLALQAGPTLGGAPAGLTMAAGMRPGTWTSLFCTDAGGVSGGAPVGYQHCIGAAANFQGQPATYFAAMRDAVLTGYGAEKYGAGAVLAQLPSRDLGSLSFYFDEWILAVTRYLQSAGNPAATLAQIDANPTDPNEVFLASDTSDVVSGEYVFRNDVDSAMQPPTDLLVTANVSTGAVTQLQFARYDFRGEKAVYTALTTTPTDLPGAEDLYLTNVVGSPLLAATYGSYACAVNTDPTNANCGNPSPCGLFCSYNNPWAPQLVGYGAAFGQSIFYVAANATAPFVLDTLGPASEPYPPIGSAMITLPIWPNPFDPTSASASDRSVSALLPYLPMGAGGGFPVSIDGSRDKFYATDQLTLTGETFEATLDFESEPFVGLDAGASDGGSTNAWAVRAVESSSFLGLVFACAQTDPQTGWPDLLALRMNDSASAALDYLARYPAAASACEIIIRYSRYGNQIEAITSLQNGVRVDFTPGPEGPVVSGATLFDPSVVPAVGQ